MGCFFFLKKILKGENFKVNLGVFRAGEAKPKEERKELFIQASCDYHCCRLPVWLRI